MTDTPKIGVTEATRREVLRLTGTDPVADLGIEVAPEPSATDIVICRRVPGDHTANSRIERCSQCKCRIWVAATTSPNPQRWCMQCFTKR